MTASTSNRVVLVCGVSGVGKTHLIRSYLLKDQAAITFSAGVIIGEGRKNADPEFLRKLPQGELLKSQQLLIEGFGRLASHITNKTLLLDAHTIIDNDAKLFRIPSNVIRNLGPPLGLIHIEDTAEAILTRREGDTSRARPIRSVAQLAEYQRASLVAAKEIASDLGVWLDQVCAGDHVGFANSVAKATTFDVK